MSCGMLSRKQVLMKKTMSAVKVGVGGVAAFGVIGMWSGNESFYKQFVNPLIAYMEPETSHRAAVYAAKYHLIKDRRHTDPDILKTRIGPLTVPNPVGIAAGFDKSGECMSGLVRMGFGWIEIGSVTPLPQEGNPKPRVFKLPEDSAVINRYGFNNDGHKVVHERVVEFKKINPDVVIGVNLGANKSSVDRIGDYCEGIKVFSDCADYYVINISSPNTPNLRELQNNENLPELLQRVMKTRESQSRKVPVFLKVAPDISDADVKTICKYVTKKETKIDGLVVSNTTTQRDTLISESSLKSEVGGLSGRPLEAVSTELVGKFYRELKGQLPIIGVGGVSDGPSAFSKISAGACAVQLYTVLAYNGPGIVDRVKAELVDILRTNAYDSVQQAVGNQSQSSRLTTSSR